MQVTGIWTTLIVSTDRHIGDRRNVAINIFEADA